MEKNKQYWEKLAAYLSGNLNNAEREEVEGWRNASKQNESDFLEAKQVWENSGVHLRLNNAETDEEWRKLQSRLNEGSTEGRAIPLFGVKSIWFKVAASLFLIAGILYIFWPAEQMVSISSDDEVATVYLPDSSKVWLNVHSTLRYSQSFNEEHRNISISGEGYFMVRPDSVKPFIIKTDLASVRVLGTSFNVKEDSAGVVLTVAEGTVSFSSTKSNEEAIVEANEKAVITPENNLSKSHNDDPAFAAWREHNNAVYEHEKQNPASYLVNNYSWEKNVLNLSVIEGILTNTAGLAVYDDIVLKVTYTKPNGKVSTSRITIFDTVEVGESVNYQKRLLDIFTDTKKVKVEIESAKVVSSARH